MIRWLPAAALSLAGAPAFAQSMPDMPGMHHPAEAAPAASAATAPPSETANMGPMTRNMMSGALGAYRMNREASGTSWQPDASQHAGVHIMNGDWMIMLHGLVNGVYDTQSGPRGDDKAFVSGMFMGMAKRGFANGDALQFRAMFSPDPWMGKSGYPLLLASGETADGRTELVDRQHPHDLFMELSASYSHRLTDRDSAFVYVGLPGEPAFGPPAFMHRLSIQDSPEAPISHHWLDSTHITMGVLTAGYIHDNWKAEVSRFRGREPDQRRFDIETGALDSTAARLSWNPTANWSLQASWADVTSPEQLSPDENVRRWSASAIYTIPVGDSGWWSTTAAWGRRTSEHGDLDAYVLESAVKPDPAWTIFGRAERTANDELTEVARRHGAAYTVSKVSLGAIHDWPLAEHLKVGLGGLYALDFTPSALRPLYGGSPHGAMAFVRFKID